MAGGGAEVEEEDGDGGVDADAGDGGEVAEAGEVLGGEEVAAPLAAAGEGANGGAGEAVGGRLDLGVLGEGGEEAADGVGVAGGERHLEVERVLVVEFEAENRSEHRSERVDEPGVCARCTR